MQMYCVIWGIQYLSENAFDLLSIVILKHIVLFHTMNQIAVLQIIW